MATKLEPDFKGQLVAALRGGKYPQGKHRLRGNDGYCCLGVGMDVAGCSWELLDGYFATLNGEKNSHTLCGMGSLVVSDPQDNQDNLTFPEEARQDYIKALSEVKAPIKYKMSLLASTLNDMGVSFQVIADLIEKYL